MLRLGPELRRMFMGVSSSIAFYPALMAAAASVAAILLLPFEYTEPALALRVYLRPALIDNPEDARTLLATLVGSVISLMVFSFSMVMVVLNRAAASLTPRVVPGLITDKTNQYVLGTYLATIVFSLVLFLNIQDPKADHRIPALGLLIATLLVLVCLAMFAVFIHRVSGAIKVETILAKIYRATCRELAAAAKASCPPPAAVQWHAGSEMCAVSTGYLRQIDYSTLAEAAARQACQVWILKPLGAFCLRGEPLLAYSRELPAAVREELAKNLLLFVSDGEGEDYRRGFSQIAEIGVKALSPSIADPVTAISAINLLGGLMQLRAELTLEDWRCDKTGEARIRHAHASFEELLYLSFAPIRAYGAGDVQVLQALIMMVAQLARFVGPEQLPALAGAARATRARAETCNDSLDRAALNNAFELCNRALPGAALAMFPAV